VPDAPRRFAIKTYGCQMNEHDSERLAGLLVADGLVPATSLEDADVIVLNTCCIRENADNRLYGHLGDLKALRERRPDLQIAVGGCLAQMDRERVVEARGARRRGLRDAQPRGCPSAPAQSGGRGHDRRGARRRRTPLQPRTRRPRSAAVRDVPWAAWMTIPDGL